MRNNIRLIKSLWLRYLIFALGWCSVALGVAGIFVPVLPTTPFMLLAAGCFARSSPRFYRWLTIHPYFGPIIADYLAGRGLPRRARRLALLMLWLGVGLGCYSVGPGWASGLMLLTAVAVSLYLLRLPVADEVKRSGIAPEK